MNIYFASKKLERIFSSQKEIRKNYGEVRGKKLQSRISFLLAANCLNDVPVTPPFRRHELFSNRKGQFAIDIVKNWRLILEPVNSPLPLKRDGGLDLVKIDKIKILNVEDYHGD